MLFMNYFFLKKEIKKYGANDKQAKKIITKIRVMRPDLKKALLDFIKKNSEIDCEVEGFSFNALTNIYKMTPINAMITLDWLCREPMLAKQHLYKLSDKIVFEAPKTIDENSSENEETISEDVSDIVYE